MTGRRSRAWIVGAVIAAVLVGAGVTSAVVYLWPADHLGELKTGDCVEYTGKDDDPYVKADCSAAGVYDKVAGFDKASNAHACWDVPGASNVLQSGDRVVCLGDKTIDPAVAINVAKAGDCVITPNPRDAFRHDCADPKAEYLILKRKTEVPVADGCSDVPGTTKSYSINWESKLEAAGRKVGQAREKDDVLLCLGPNPTVVAAFSSAQAARSDCRFLDDAAMAAAVTRGAGKPYTVSQHLEGKQASLGCEYQFGSVKERVMVEFTKIPFDPAQAKVLTIDGLRAYYDAGVGNRALGVEINGGVFSVVVWLADTGDAFSQKVAIEVFRAARPKIT